MRLHQRPAPFVRPTRVWAAPRNQGGATFARALSHLGGRGEVAGPGWGVRVLRSEVASCQVALPLLPLPSGRVWQRGPHLGVRFRCDPTRSQFRLGTAVGREGGAVETRERRGPGKRGSVGKVPRGRQRASRERTEHRCFPARQRRRLGDPGSGVRYGAGTGAGDPRSYEGCGLRW